MQIKKQKWVVCIVLLLLPFLMQAQQKSNTASLIKQANKEYVMLKYATVVQLLDKVLKNDPNNLAAKEMMANSYRKTKDYKKAAYWYEQLTKEQKQKPEWALYYAEALANVQRYSESEKWYQQYLSLSASDGRAAAFVKAYPTVSSFMQNKNAWKIGYTNINTAASEYSPAFYKDGLIFSSNRKQKNLSKQVFGWDQTPFTDLFYVDKLSDVKQLNPDSMLIALRKDSLLFKKLYKSNDDDTYFTSNDSRVLGSIGKLLKNDTLGDVLSYNSTVRTLPGKVNAKYHEGPAVSLTDGSLIFTRSNYFKGKTSRSEEGINKLKLFTASGTELDQIVAFPFNSDEYSVGHPTTNKAGTLLIFSSDMPGGSGGVDLYFSKRATIKDQWGKPVNMGKLINTEGDEMFPSLYQDSVLFFASTGHPGLGGLDIFQIAINETDVKGKAINLGAPVNSSVDDFGLIRSEDGMKGYFTSNRRGSDDIYSFLYHDYQLKLKGKVIDATTAAPIAKATISIPNYETFAPITTTAEGTFEIPLAKETAYKLTATKVDYSNASSSLSTIGIFNDTTLTVLFKLNKIAAPAKLIPAIPVNTCDSIKNQLQAFKIYYDLDKSFIRNDAEEVMQKLLVFLKANPEVKLIAASHCDSRASINYNIALSLRRSTSARAYLIKHGIAENRIKIQYYGEGKLVNACKDDVPCSEEEQQLNRRTEFYLLLDGVKVQDLDCKILNGKLK